MEEGGCEAIGVTIPVLCLCSMNEEHILLNVLLHLLLAVWIVRIPSIVFLTACSVPCVLICYPFHRLFVGNVNYSFPV